MIAVCELEQLGIRVIHSTGLPAPPSEELRWYIHSHQHFELHLIEEGRRLYRTAEGLFSLEAGQFCLFAPGVYHTPVSSPEPVVCFGLSFELMEKHAPVRDWLEARTREQPVWIGEAKELCRLPGLLRQQDGGAFPLEMLQASDSLLILQLVRAMDLQPQLSVPAQQDRNELRGYLMDDFFHNRFHLPAGEEELAGLLGVSRRQLDRILKQRYGKSFREKLLEMRLQVACDLLRSSPKTIGQIAECVGYSTPSNFTAFFRQATGMTPGEYRKRHQNC